MVISEQEKIAFLKKGKEVENEFAKLFNETIASTKEEDMKEHWDIKVVTKIDVKGLKKKSRSDDEVNEHEHFLEVKGITGLPGWLYGKADFFAFELKYYWVVVSKEDLQKFVKENVKKEWVPRPTLYKLYRRKDRKDAMTLVTSYDLIYICTKLIKKQ